MTADGHSPSPTAPNAPGAAPGARAETIEWIERLVRIDTTSRKSNLGLIETVRDHLAGAGFASTLTYDAPRGKANLFATVPDANGGTQGGVALSGHTDVVPVDGQKWSTDPFAPVIQDGKMYGRGTCDMKGFIGTAIALLPRMKGAKLKKPIHFALSYDEELGCIGAPVMLDDLKARGIHPDGCVVGEPTSMRVVVANKGIHCYKCKVHGHAAHSSLTPAGINAIEYAARLIVHIREIVDELRAKGPYDQAFDVPFTTGQTGLIKGGVAANVIPALCEFEFEFRNLPGVDGTALFNRVEAFAREKLVPQMKKERSEGDIVFEKVAISPALEAHEEAEMTKLVRALTRDTATKKVAYATEAGIFQNAGISAVLCGPGDIEQAHKPNEFVALDQIARCEDFLTKLIDSLT
ncbi:MAG TPA: acetylornithine deacetylase [Magnetospirillaceae bacterium]